MLKTKVLFLFIIATSIIGCGSLQTPSSQTPELVLSNIPPYDRERSANEYGRITLTAPRYEPVISSNIFIRGKKKGAALGAADGATGCLEMANDAVGAFLALICMPIAAIAGGVSSSANTEPLEMLENHEATVLKELSNLAPQIIVKQQALAYAAQYGLKLSEPEDEYGPDNPDHPFNYSVSPQDISDTFLELGIDKISLRGFGTRGIRYNIYYFGHSKLIRSDNNEIIDSLNIVWRSGEYTAKEWSDNNFERLKQSVASAGNAIARESIDEYFLLYYPIKKSVNTKKTKDLHPFDALNHVEKISTKPDPVPYYALRPLSPSINIRPGMIESLTGDWEFSEIRSTRPLFKWETFPRTVDIERITLDQITGVTYEFKLFSSSTDEGHYSYPEREIYHRIGIEKPFHSLEIELEPCKRYYWTVRACFELNGTQKLTEWSGRYPDSEIPYPVMRRRSIPISGYRASGGYYGFKLVGDGNSCP